MDGISQELCQRVLDGVEGAEEELNRIAAEVQSQQKQQVGPPEPETGVFRKIASGKSGGGVKQEIGRQLLVGWRRLAFAVEAANGRQAVWMDTWDIVGARGGCMSKRLLSIVTASNTLRHSIIGMMDGLARRGS